ncbi:hypothetical protein ACFPRL_23805 [Pseudoclavibacter helvolus]
MTSGSPQLPHCSSPSIGPCPRPSWRIRCSGTGPGLSSSGP